MPQSWRTMRSAALTWSAPARRRPWGRLRRSRRSSGRWTRTTVRSALTRSPRRCAQPAGSRVAFQRVLKMDQYVGVFIGSGMHVACRACPEVALHALSAGVRGWRHAWRAPSTAGSERVVKRARGCAGGGRLVRDLRQQRARGVLQAVVRAAGAAGRGPGLRVLPLAVGRRRGRC